MKNSEQLDVDKAYENFFKGRAKFPKFKKKEHAQSVRYALDQRHIAKNYRPGGFLKLPNMGKSVGMDVGIKDVIVTSDGFYSGSPKFT